MIIPHNALILVADGRKAVLLRNDSAGANLSLRLERRLEPEILEDDGPSGARPAEQTTRQTDEATFAKQLSQRLYRMLQRHEFEALVLAADPQTLGQMRAAMHKEVERSIVVTIDKNLTNHTLPQIADALA